ncbi:RcnB family protein [Brevundimonas sp.]|uniref:RcnB family protein n=1 Tax=Brevundimonas sp. TaxID=1871086 RepID=UPI0025D6CFCE|nr:RcnB family protein [Brevundimonas sp.]
MPRQYWNRQWRVGEYLPTYFWRYVVQDYSWYGLPYPPYGCQWVYVNNDILLVDMRDGYIIDVVYRVWTW